MCRTSSYSLHFVRPRINLAVATLFLFGSLSLSSGTEAAPLIAGGRFTPRSLALPRLATGVRAATKPLYSRVEVVGDAAASAPASASRRRRERARLRLPPDRLPTEGMARLSAHSWGFRNALLQCDALLQALKLRNPVVIMPFH